jgi:hypothetical protein
MKKVTSDEMRCLLTQLGQSGQVLTVCRGQVMLLEHPKPELIPILKRVFSNRSLAVRTLKETRCSHCWGRLDEHEIGGEAICFHCWIDR